MNRVERVDNSAPRGTLASLAHEVINSDASDPEILRAFQVAEERLGSRISKHLWAQLAAKFAVGEKKLDDSALLATTTGG